MPALILLLAATLAQAQPPQPPDPFAGLDTAAPTPAPEATHRGFFHDNFGFRTEVMSQFDIDQTGNFASRQSLGFEALKKFSTDTSTIASFDVQLRLVRRDGFNPVSNDMEGVTRPGWALEYHNLYFDLYNILNPFLAPAHRGKNAGRFNLRVGRFYLPFGLNQQTDTHGTVLQLSNEMNFGFERDWSAGLYGSLNKHLNYDLYYLVGSGYDVKWKGQSGLAALRLSLGNKYNSERGIEGGLSFVAGERLVDSLPVKTQRLGLDLRARRAAPRGTLTFTNELSAGRDASLNVITQLHQAEYLHASRRWGLATQYRRMNFENMGADSSIAAEFTWYFRNDVGNSNAHWIKLNIEKQLEHMTGHPATLITLQYYFYR